MDVIKTYPSFLEGISFFYTITASQSPYIFSGTQGVAQRRLPDGTLDVVFNLGGAVELSRDGIHFSPMPRVSVTGLYPDRSFVRYHDHVHLLGAVFRPGSAHLFINEVLTQFRADTIDAGLVFGSHIYSLLDQLHYTCGIQQKHELLEDFLRPFPKANKEAYNHARIYTAVEQIHRFKGAIAVGQLQQHVLMSERNFRRKFNEFVGMAPKKYADIIRLKEVTKSYLPSQGSYQAHLLQAGYTDHAHFNKDFQRITGIGPTDFFKGLHAMDSGFIQLI